MSENATSANFHAISQLVDHFLELQILDVLEAISSYEELIDVINSNYELTDDERAKLKSKIESKIKEVKDKTKEKQES
jgi:ElaB/YqjD/DUF883 family membrane-anchored ribosome-binding protein